MADKEKIDYLLIDIRELEKQVSGIRNAEVYPVSFFSQTFELAHKILTDLHALEAEQLEVLSRQMEEHRQRIHSTPYFEASPQPEKEIPAEEKRGVSDKTEIVIVHNKVEPEPEPEFIEEQILSGSKDLSTTIEQKKLEDLAEKRLSASLNEIIGKKNLSDFRKAFSLNDRFHFRRELFGGDEERMNKAIAELNEINSYEESITYLNETLRWNVEDEAVSDFINLLEKRFS